MSEQADPMPAHGREVLASQPFHGEAKPCAVAQGTIARMGEDS